MSGSVTEFERSLEEAAAFNGHIYRGETVVQSAKNSGRQSPISAVATLLSEENEISVSHRPSGSILKEAAATLRELYGDKLDAVVVERLVVGVFFVGVKLSNGCGGVAYMPPELIRSTGSRILKGSMPTIRGMRAAALMDGGIRSPFGDVIMMAALNALSVPFMKIDRYCVDTIGELSGLPSLFINRRVCIVGAITPLLKRLKVLGAAEVSIIDRKKETLVDAGYGTFVPPERTAETLARCETAVFTGAAIANGTIEHLISLVPETAAIAVVGATAAFVPQPLFRRNVALVETDVVTNSDLALEIVAEGGGGRRLFFGRGVSKINLLNVERLRQLGLDSTS